MTIQVKVRWNESNFLGTLTHYLVSQTTHYPQGEGELEPNTGPATEFFTNRAKTVIEELVSVAVEPLAKAGGVIVRPPVRVFYRGFWLDIDPVLEAYDERDRFKVVGPDVIREIGAIERERKGFIETYDYEIDSEVTAAITVTVTFLTVLKQ